MKYRYRLLLFFLDWFIATACIVTTVILGIYVKNKVAVTIMAFVTFFVLNAILAMWIVTSKIRTNETKLAWLLSFFLFPIIAMLIYLIWGRSPYKVRTITEYKEKFQKYLSLYPKFDSSSQDHPCTNTFNHMAQYSENVRGTVINYNNDYQVIQSNSDFYEIVINAVREAKENIFLQYYIVDDGFFLNSLVDELIKKADEGVKIHFLFDRYGCQMKFTPAMVAYLASHPNIQVAKFESDRDIKYRSANNFRNHRKVLIIDNKKAIYGGSNIADEYISLRYKHPNWKDLNFVITGEIVKTMLVDFCLDWDFSAHLPYVYQLSDYINCPYVLLKPFLFVKHYLNLCPERKIFTKAIKTRKTPCILINKLEKMGYFEVATNNKIEHVENRSLFVQTGPRYYNNIIAESLSIACSSAKKSIKIISPYLQPNDTLYSALKAASYRNVQVELILPGSCDDKWFLLDMNRIYYQSLLESNANIYEFAGFIHTKLIIIDDQIAITGTFNLDFRSLTSNFESLLILEDKKSVSQLLSYWHNCLESSELFSKFDLFENTTLKSCVIKSGLQIIQPLL